MHAFVNMHAEKNTRCSRAAHACGVTLWAESISLYTSELIRLLLSSVTSSLNTSNPVPLEVMHAHAITLLHNVSQMMLYALDHELFSRFACYPFEISLGNMMLAFTAMPMILSSIFLRDPMKHTNLQN